MTLDQKDLLNVPVEWREDPAFYEQAERYQPRHRWCRVLRGAAEDRTQSPYGGVEPLEAHTGVVLAAAPGRCVLVMEPARKMLHIMPADCVRTLGVE